MRYVTDLEIVPCKDKGHNMECLTSLTLRLYHTRTKDIISWCKYTGSGILLTLKLCHHTRTMVIVDRYMYV